MAETVKVTALQVGDVFYEGYRPAELNQVEKIRPLVVGRKYMVIDYLDLTDGRRGNAHIRADVDVSLVERFYIDRSYALLGSIECGDRLIILRAKTGELYA